MTEHAEDVRLPDLTGSPKQIAWASDLRAAALTQLDDFRAGMAAHVATHPEAAAEQAANNAALDQAIAAHTDARWWIDLRRSGAEGIAYALRQDAHARLERQQP